MNCRHYPSYPNCSCDIVSCVLMRSTANPAGLESFGGLVGDENLQDARAKVSELAIKLNEANAKIERLRLALGEKATDAM